MKGGWDSGVGGGGLKFQVCFGDIIDKPGICFRQNIQGGGLQQMLGSNLCSIKSKQSATLGTGDSILSVYICRF